MQSKGDLFFDYNVDDYGIEGLEPISIGLGEFVFSCKRIELKPTKAGGKLLNLGWVCQSEGPYKGAWTFTGHNVVCPTSLEAEQIGRGEISGIALVMGLHKEYKETKSYEILMNGLVGGVTKKDGEGTQYEKNKIKYFKDPSKVKSMNMQKLSGRPSPTDVVEPDDEIPY